MLQGSVFIYYFAVFGFHLMHQPSLLKLIKSEPLARAAIAVPAAGTLIGSLFLAQANFVACLLMDAFGLLAGLLLLIVLVLKFLMIERLLMDGDAIEGRVTELKDNPGISLVQTTHVEYRYRYDGVEYKKRILVHLPEDEHLQKPTIMVDPHQPDNSIIKELYCVC